MAKKKAIRVLSEEQRKKKVQRTATWRKNHPEHKQQRRELDREKRADRYAKAAEWRRNNPEKVRATHKKSKSKNRDRVKEQWSSWYERNKEAVKAKARARYAQDRYRYLLQNKRWRNAHKQERRDYMKKWVHENAHRVKATNRKRYAMRRGASDGTISSASWKLLLEQSGYKCHYCKRDIHDLRKPLHEMTSTERLTKATMDHVIPVNEGGAHSLSNIVPACFSCNSKKSDGELSAVA